MQIKRPQDFRMAFIDALMNVLTAIVAISALSFLLINLSKKSNDGIEKKAEFVAQIEWQKDLDCDIDMWVRDGNDTVVSFQRKDYGLMNIERDDLGFHGDGIVTKNGTKIVAEDNGETWVARGIVPGTYVFNAHVYGCKTEPGGTVVIQPGAPAPKQVIVRFKLIRLNPSYTEVYTREITLDKVWEEKTIVSTTISADRSLSDIKTDNIHLVVVNRDSHGTGFSQGYNR